MTPDFLVIAITPPSFIKNEADRIQVILSEKKAHMVHIRKPDSSLEEIDNLINNIKPEYHSRIKLHDHFELLNKYNLGGIHLNSRNPEMPEDIKSNFEINPGLTVSKSLHSLEEIEVDMDLDYFFISPIFDSISKSGYRSKFDLDLLSKSIKGKKAIALGGVTPCKFDLLKNLGFFGAALLGHFFPTKK